MPGAASDAAAATDVARARPTVVLGVDVGTTSVKVGAYDPLGHELASTSHGYPLREPSPGFAEQDSEQMLGAMTSAIRGTTEAAREQGAQIAGVSVSAAMHGLMALDRHDHPLSHLITWADIRASKEAEWLAAEHPELHDRTGTPLHPMAPLPKLLWFRDHEPAVFAATRRWVGLKELILARLTGEWLVDHSCASGTGLLGLGTLEWDPEALALAGVTTEQLCPVVPVTDVRRLSAGGASATGLAPGTPVVVGAGDGPLANLGVGAIDHGELACSIGTSSALRLMVPDAVVDRDHELFCYAFVPGRWLIGGASNNGGAVLAWLRRVFDNDAPERLLAEAERVPAGSEGLIMLPYLFGERAPRWSTLPRAAYLGVKHSHRRGHLVRAALEGVCYQLALVLDSIRVAGNEIGEVRATGGFARSALWRQLLADILGMRVGFAQGEEGAALGAALLGMVALGPIDSIEAAGTIARITEEVAPDPVTASLYAGQHRLFADLNRDFEPVFRRMHQEG